jgi:HEAT repeat protein
MPGDLKLIDALAKAAEEDADFMIGNFAYIALGRIGGERSEKILLDALDETSRASLPFVALGIGLLGDASHGPRLLHRFEEINDISGKAALALAVGLTGYKPAAEAIRKGIAEESSPTYKGYYAQALGLLEDHESTDMLIETYANEVHSELLRQIAMALGLAGDLDALRDLQRFLGDSSSDRRRVATAYNLGFLGDERAMDPLYQIASDENQGDLVRRYALLGLGHMGDARPYPLISKITRHHNFTILEGFLHELYNIQ